MSELVEFLRARFAAELDDIEGYDGGWNDADGCWGIHVDPEFTRADVQAKKRLLELHPHTTMRQDLGEARLRVAYGPNWEKRLKRVDDVFCTTCHVEDGVIESSGQPCETLRLLALPYVNHPDYREEWKP
ncbi:DUF6221 family protein [Streptomyces sp. NPDC008240]|uniref:DUF6221 family protein n=1 Tax=Streptomyces sp. NPDC008240 TaxID=3364822 RepID=UPI0036F04A45